MKLIRNGVFLAVFIGIVFVALNSWISFARMKPNEIHKLVDSDAFGYYTYLPSTFIEHDVLHQWFAMRLENGYHLNKYTCGVALMESPFYFIAHAITLNSNAEMKTGRGPVYMILIAVAASFYLYLSLLILFNYIRRKLDLKTAIYTVIALYFGTNLFYYTVVEPGMSHVYSLFCFAVCLYAIDKFYSSFKTKHIVLFSIFFGLATLIRPTNIVMILFFLFYEVYSGKEFRERFIFHLKNYKNFLIMLVIGAIVCSPQMWYWYKTTGSPIVFSYGYNNESFTNWKSPKILEVLGHYKSGWLFYSPIMVLSLIGMFLTFRKKILSSPTIILVFLLVLYICASWWAHTFGCAYGYRSFVEYYSILALPFAYTSYRVLNLKKWKLIFTVLFILVSIFLFFFNLKLMYMYVIHGGCWDGPEWTWEREIPMIDKVFQHVLPPEWTN